MHADRVELLLFREDGLDRPSFRFTLDPLIHRSGSTWHCRLSAAVVDGAKYYGYVIHGPRADAAAGSHAFDPEKLLLDPYARSVFFPPAFDREAARLPGSNFGKAPLALLDECRCAFEWKGPPRVSRDQDLIIYEMHVRGFTRHESSGIESERRGTFAGVIEKIPYLRELGVTALELMPVHQFDPQEGNYWGYMPLNFFAPHHAYATNPQDCVQRSEFRQMVQALHDAGIQVILDVVFNHTCEGNATGPTYCYKGIDNETYYLTTPGEEPYLNFSGCGNTLRTRHPTVRRLIVDSLRRWATEMRVDGFRFDLASIFARDSEGTLAPDDPPVIAEIEGDPALTDLHLIAEPWDAAGAFQLGRDFPGVLWMQWNACYRDTLQRFMRGDGGLVGELMTRLYGSSELFPDDAPIACRPYQSVNYVSSHDGSTMYDLVSYSRRHNEANGHGNVDGPSEFSRNCGREGEEGVPEETIRLRKRLVKNFVCLLMLSNGTPMFRMGDEFLQTQGGNSNPYNQDNETSWLDWRRLERHRDVFRFF